MKNKQISFFIFTFCLLLLGGCASLPVEKEAQQPRPTPLKEALPQSVYPEKFTMNQRIILTINGKEYDFIGFLAVDDSSGFRAMTFGEMGGKVFDLAFKNNMAEIIKKPENMPLRPIVEGVIGDIRHLFFQPAFKEALQLKDEEDKSFFIILRDTTEQTEYHYSAGRELFHSKHVSENRIIREASYSDYKKFPGWNKAVPSRISLVNHQWNYSLDITLVKLTEGIRNQQVTMH